MSDRFVMALAPSIMAVPLLVMAGLDRATPTRTLPRGTMTHGTAMARSGRTVPEGMAGLIPGSGPGTAMTRRRSVPVRRWVAPHHGASHA